MLLSIHGSKWFPWQVMFRNGQWCGRIDLVTMDLPCLPMVNEAEKLSSLDQAGTFYFLCVLKGINRFVGPMLIRPGQGCSNIVKPMVQVCSIVNILEFCSVNDTPSLHKNVMYVQKGHNFAKKDATKTLLNFAT